MHYMHQKKKAMSKVNHPAHYNMGSIEVIDVIEDWQLSFNLGNTVKYVARSEYKGNQIQDLKKAVWYLEREISLLIKQKEIYENG